MKNLNQRLKKISRKEACLYDYQLSIIVYDDDESQLDKAISKIKKLFYAYGIVPIDCKGSAQWIWKTQFPSIEQMVHTTKLLSNNIAHLISFGKEPTSFLKNDWGNEPITLFKTISGGSYGLQLHDTSGKEALAHSLVIAPAGSGKTTLFQHIIAGALRYDKVKCIIFDRYNGTEVFTNSIGGQHIDITGENREFPINPFCCDSTNENKRYLDKFLKQLSKCDDTNSELLRSRLINLMFSIPKDQRILANVMECFLPSNSALYRGLFKWVSDDSYGQWFNGNRKINGKTYAYDSLDIKENYLTTFEMTEVINNAEIAANFISYVMYKLRCVVRKTSCPHLIFIDEAAPMLDNPYFKQEVEVLFNEHRKLRGSINICFQTPQALDKSGIAKIIIMQCPNIFLFQNLSARREDYINLNLTDFEWNYISGQMNNNNPHTVLLKRKRHSIILNTNLSTLGEYLTLYSSGSRNVMLAREYKELYGDKVWVKRFLSNT